MSYIVKVLATEFVTHNVKRFVIEKPAEYTFIPGQATDVAINQPGLENELRPFTFTSLNSADHLEFIIKIYTGHNGITEKLAAVNAGDELIVHDVFGSITYNKPGVFIAGGAGITPFIAILRQLRAEGKLAGNTLLFANRTSTDVILKDELNAILGDAFINVLGLLPDNTEGKYIDKALLKTHGNSTSSYYICGPDKFTEIMIGYLRDLGIPNSQIIIEQ